MPSDFFSMQLSWRCMRAVFEEHCAGLNLLQALLSLFQFCKLESASLTYGHPQ
jgi:hypothetical protein